VDDLLGAVVLAHQMLGDLHVHHLEVPVVTFLRARLDARKPLVQCSEVADNGPDLVGIRLDVDIYLCLTHERSIAQRVSAGKRRRLCWWGRRTGGHPLPTGRRTATPGRRAGWRSAAGPSPGQGRRACRCWSRPTRDRRRRSAGRLLPGAATRW